MPTKNTKTTIPQRISQQPHNLFYRLASTQASWIRRTAGCQSFPSKELYLFAMAGLEIS